MTGNMPGVTGRGAGHSCGRMPADPSWTTTGPLSVLISAALLVLTAVAGVAGIGGFAALGRSAAGSVTTVAAASTISIPPGADRRSVPMIGTAGHQQFSPGWAPHDPDPAEVTAAGWLPPAGKVAEVVEAGPTVLARTVQVAHRGRAPPAGSDQT